MYVQHPIPQEGRQSNKTLSSSRSQRDLQVQNMTRQTYTEFPGQKVEISSLEKPMSQERNDLHKIELENYRADMMYDSQQDCHDPITQNNSESTDRSLEQKLGNSSGGNLILSAARRKIPRERAHKLDKNMNFAVAHTPIGKDKAKDTIVYRDGAKSKFADQLTKALNPDYSVACTEQATSISLPAVVPLSNSEQHTTSSMQEV